MGQSIVEIKWRSLQESNTKVASDHESGEGFLLNKYFDLGPKLKRMSLVALCSLAPLALHAVGSVAVNSLGDQVGVPLSTRKDSQFRPVSDQLAEREPTIEHLKFLPTSQTRELPTFARSSRQSNNDDAMKFLWPLNPQPLSSADTITYTYDSLNRLAKVEYSDGSTITYTYDAAGNRTSIQVTGASSSLLGIDSVVARAGRSSGGQQVRLTGAFANLSMVTIGGLSVSWFYTNGGSDTSAITITTPPHSVGAVQIDLTPVSGSGYSKPNAFAYLPTVFTDDTLVVGGTTAKAQHIVELRQAVDALRAVAGLSAAPWTNATLTPGSSIIKATDILELRTYLDDAASRLGYPTAPYTDHPLSTGFLIRRVHIEELRQRIRAIAG